MICSQVTVIHIYFSLGYYLYLEASGGRYGDNVRLASPNLQGSCTLRLYYHMFGQHVNALNVYVRTTRTGSGVKVSSVQGEQGDNWLRLEAPITPSGNQPFQIIIEGMHQNLLCFSFDFGGEHYYCRTFILCVQV